MSTWVVVADSGRARIFEAAHKLDELIEVQGFMSSSHRDNTGGDPRGRGGDGHGSGVHHGLEARTSIREHDATVAARELADFLHHAFNKHQFKAMVLIAAPDFLGELRKVLDTQLQAVIMKSIDKDYTRCSPVELAEHLSGS